MSSRRGNVPKLDLKLYLSPTRSSSHDLEAYSSPNSSIESSCASTDPVDGQPPAATKMVIVGCPRCLMFVMLPETGGPICPQCKSSILLDYVSGDVINPSAANDGR